MRVNKINGRKERKVITQTKNVDKDTMAEKKEKSLRRQNFLIKIQRQKKEKSLRRQKMLIKVVREQFRTPE